MFRVLQVPKSQLVGRDPCLLMLQAEYLLIDEFNGNQTAVVHLFNERFPDTLMAVVGPDSWNIQYASPMFDTQDAWHASATHDAAHSSAKDTGWDSLETS
jgi:hypothetical protein